jgi:hypothetical protein
MLQRGIRRVLWVFGGVGEVLVATYAVPLCILAIGTPIALVVRLVMWTVGAV